jgi:hypothetical protein
MGTGRDIPEDTDETPPTDGQQGQAETPGNSPETATGSPAAAGGDSPAMTALMESMREAVTGIHAGASEAADRVPKLKAEHEKQSAIASAAYQAEDFERYQRANDALEALEKMWQATMRSVGPDPTAYGLPEHPALVDPDR